MVLQMEQKEGDECRGDRVGPWIKEYGTEMSAGWLPTSDEMAGDTHFTFSLIILEQALHHLVEKFLYLYLSYLKF